MFFADYFQIVNIAGMLLQLFVVSRAVKYLGVPVALCIFRWSPSGATRWRR